MARGRLSIGITGALVAAVMTIAPVAAEAQRWRGGPPPGYDQGRRGGGDDRGYRGGERDYRGEDRYYGRGERGGPPRGYRRHRCRDNGTGGTIIGAIAGGLLGNSIAGNGDRTAGALVGGGLGALAGRAIDRDC